MARILEYSGPEKDGDFPEDMALDECPRIDLLVRDENTGPDDSNRRRGRHACMNFPDACSGARATSHVCSHSDGIGKNAHDCPWVTPPGTARSRFGSVRSGEHTSGRRRVPGRADDGEGRGAAASQSAAASGYPPPRKSNRPWQVEAGEVVRFGAG